MDRTINPERRPSKRRQARNWKAWQLISQGSVKCPFCPHSAADHVCSSAQPHYYRLATEGEKQNPWEKLYRHDPVSSTGEALPNGDFILVKRVVVANRAEIITSFCLTCADELQTHQALCYQRTLANGEVVGLETLTPAGEK